MCVCARVCVCECVCMYIYSHIITKCGYGYWFLSGATISHLLYMDDTKLYARNPQDIDSLIHIIKIYLTLCKIQHGFSTSTHPPCPSSDTCWYNNLAKRRRYKV